MSWLLDGLNAILNSFINVVVGPTLGWAQAELVLLWQTILNYLWQFGIITWTWWGTQSQTLIDGLWGLVPSSFQPPISAVANLLGAADQFMPVSETLAIMGVLTAFWISWVTLKIAWHLIPFFH